MAGPRPRTALTVALTVAVIALAAVAGCTTAPAPPPDSTGTVTSTVTSTDDPTPGPTTGGESSWRVGARPLPRRADGFGRVLPTPPQLANRDLPTVDHLPPPPGGRFAATVAPVPAAVLARSTWRPGCPVAAAELRYLTVSFWGFDDRAHTGELIVARSVADAVTRAFSSLFRARFPIEEMRVVAADELTAPPTGDGNNTTAFVCRPAVGQRRWSSHALGLAVDVNPFCNPYVRGDLVLPELASSYLDRSVDRPGMVQPGGPAIRAFTAIGWRWGGEWASPVDLQHFSATGD